MSGPPRLQYRHSTGSGMQPLETSALQAGLQTMPHRIPPLPEIPPGEVRPIAWPALLKVTRLDRCGRGKMQSLLGGVGASAAPLSLCREARAVSPVVLPG